MFNFSSWWSFNEGVNGATFEILQDGFHEVDEKEQDEVNERVNVINFEILQHGFHKVDEKKQEIVVQGGEWYFHDVEKWAWNRFDEWRRQKSYPTNINVEHLYANDCKNLVEILVKFFAQV